MIETQFDLVHIDPAKYTVAVLRVPKTVSMHDIERMAAIMNRLREDLGLAQAVIVPEDSQLSFEQFDGPVVPLVNGEPVTK